MVIMSIVLFAGVLGIGIFIGYQISENKFANNSPQEIHSQEGKLTNPLLECSSAEILYEKDLSSFRGKLQNYVDERLNNDDNFETISIYYRDLQNGPWVGINEDELFMGGSLHKVSFLVAALKTIQENPELLEEKRLFSEEMLEEVQKAYEKIGIQIVGQTYEPKQDISVGNSYTIAQLLEYMIVYSSNNAMHLLSGFIGPDNLQKVEYELGVISDNKQDEYGDYLSTIEYASLFRVLYNSSYLEQQWSEYALELLSRVDFDWGISAALPNDIVFANKFGEMSVITGSFAAERQLHDCGIVYYPDHPYLLCVMTRGYQYLKLEQTLQGVSQIVYDEVDKKYR
jgi:beta-lactamase class A